MNYDKWYGRNWTDIQRLMSGCLNKLWRCRGSRSTRKVLESNSQTRLLSHPGSLKRLQNNLNVYCFSQGWKQLMGAGGAWHRAYVVNRFFESPVQNTVLDRKSDTPQASCSCSSCVVTFYWIRTRLLGVQESKKKNWSHDKRGEQSLSTCSKTQCSLLKTVKGGISLQWAKSRLQGIRDRGMKALGNGGSGGWGGVTWRTAWYWQDSNKARRPKNWTWPDAADIPTKGARYLLWRMSWLRVSGRPTSCSQSAETERGECPGGEA